MVLIMANSLRLMLAQLNPKVGDLSGNEALVRDAIAQAEASAVGLLVFPELMLTGYPPEDLLYRAGFLNEVENTIQRLATGCQQITAVVGAPCLQNGELFNAAYVLADGQVKAIYCKQQLPNYGVFDEKRYFTPGQGALVIECQGYHVGLCVCEDLWSETVAGELKQSGAELIVSLNASPYHQGKAAEREQVISQRVTATGLPIAYVNLSGGQDEVVFDGGSFIANENSVSYLLPDFEAGLALCEFDGKQLIAESAVDSEQDSLAQLYQALVVGVRDYVNKNGFKGVVIGLSGGIDSALTLAVAVDALGAERVETVMMPSRYTSDMSLTDAKLIADNFGVAYHIVAIEDTFQTLLGELAPIFDGAPVDTTEENMQARIRGLMVMGVSNKKGLMVLTTGNKSEYAVGYSTLYGDMVGGFAPLKDVYKTLVFQLCEWRNRDQEMIPQRIIDRPPSAELAPDQKDEDSLPPYDILDQILALYIEEQRSGDAIVEAGFDADFVRDTIRRVTINEYKRRQSAPGVKVTDYAFGRERRYPITNGFSDSTRS